MAPTNPNDCPPHPFYSSPPLRRREPTLPCCLSGLQRRWPRHVALVILAIPTSATLRCSSYRYLRPDCSRTDSECTPSVVISRPLRVHLSEVRCRQRQAYRLAAAWASARRVSIAARYDVRTSHEAFQSRRTRDGHRAQPGCIL